MDKAVLISIRPKWCMLIASGKKTIEIRKTRPKLETPFKCYIYCTKYDERRWEYDVSHVPTTFIGLGKVIGEFVCEQIDHFDSAFDEWARSTAPAGSVIDSMGWEKFTKAIEVNACMTMKQLEEYFPEDVSAYLWNISGLKIYDKPKELSEFRRPCNKTANTSCFLCDRCTRDADGICCKNHIDRPPQSWCYALKVGEVPK